MYIVKLCGFCGFCAINNIHNYFPNQLMPSSHQNAAFSLNKKVLTSTGAYYLLSHTVIFCIAPHLMHASHQKTAVLIKFEVANYNRPSASSSGRVLHSIDFSPSKSIIAVCETYIGFLRCCLQQYHYIR